MNRFLASTLALALLGAGEVRAATRGAEREAPAVCALAHHRAVVAEAALAGPERIGFAGFGVEPHDAVVHKYARRRQRVFRAEYRQQCLRDRRHVAFGIDRQGVYRLMGADPARVGQASPMVATRDGRLLGEAVWAVAEAGGGWVDYQISNPDTLALVDKTSYVRQVGDDLAIGCGVYKHAQDAVRDTALSGAAPVLPSKEWTR